MNERIKELAEQAMTATTNKFSADREWSADEWRDFYDAKFAELIVKECIKVVDDTMTENQEMNIGLVMASAQIVAHFGVEE